MTFDRCAAERFLAQSRVAVFAVGTPSGPPAAVPLWFHYRPGQPYLWVIVGERTRKAGLVRATGTATLVVETSSPRIRFVSVELTLREISRPTLKEFEQLSTPHLAEDRLRSFLDFAGNNLEHEQKMTFETTRWRFADLSPDDGAASER